VAYREQDLVRAGEHAEAQRIAERAERLELHKARRAFRQNYVRPVHVLLAVGTVPFVIVALLVAGIVCLSLASYDTLAQGVLFHAGAVLCVASLPMGFVGGLVMYLRKTRR
jgi:hypothetical protein